MPNALDILTMVHLREMRAAAHEVLSDEEYAGATAKAVKLCEELHKREGGSRFEAAKRAIAMVAQRVGPDSAQTIILGAGALDWLEDRVVAPAPDEPTEG